MHIKYDELVYTCFSIPMKEHEFEQTEAIIEDFIDKHDDEWNIETTNYKQGGCMVISHEDEPCNLGIVIELTQAIVDSLGNPDPVTILWTGESECEGGKVTIRKNMEPEVFTPAIAVNQ